jgi:hypothetical protein
MSILTTHVDAPPYDAVSMPSVPEPNDSGNVADLMTRDVTAVTSNLMLSHETSAETLLSALQKGLLISRQSLAPKRFVRGDEEGDESCEKTRCIARGEMNPAMVGFRMTGECTGFALMQFEAVTYVAHNVFRLPTAREPTEDPAFFKHHFCSFSTALAGMARQVMSAYVSFRFYYNSRQFVSANFTH